MIRTVRHSGGRWMCSTRHSGRSCWTPVLLSLVLPGLVGCSSEPNASRDRSPSRWHGSEDPLAEVMEADRDLLRAVEASGLEARVAAFAEDGAMIPASGPVLAGHEAIRETMSPSFATRKFTLTWQPSGGAVAASGDLAYTFGTYEQRVESRLVTRGRYVTVWRREEDGRWRVIRRYRKS